MKKLGILLSIVVIALSLCGCAFGDYQKANSLMKAGDYEQAYEIFVANKDYKDSKERALQCCYQLGEQKFSEEDYAAAFNYFKTAEDYNDAEERANESSYLAGKQAEKEWEPLVQEAIQNHQPEQLLKCIESYYGMEPFSEEILAEMNDYVCQSIENSLAEKDYDAFLLLDSVTSYLEKDTKFAAVYDPLSKMRDDSSKERAMAFLSGEWVRLDTSRSSGLKIKIDQTEENTYAMILEDLKMTDDRITSASFHWDKGLLIWNNILISKDNIISMDQMWLTSYYNLGVQATSYHHGVGLLDYEHMRIINQSDSNDDVELTWAPYVDSNIYVKKSAIKEMPPLTEDDFLVEGTNDEGLEETINLSEQLTNNNPYYYLYEKNEKTATNRGISIGSSWDDVVAQYGYGHGNLYVEADDGLHSYLDRKHIKTDDDTLLASLLSEQVDDYMDYHMQDSQLHLRVYFKNDVVTWVCWYFK